MPLLIFHLKHSVNPLALPCAIAYIPHTKFKAQLGNWFYPDLGGDFYGALQLGQDNE